MRIDLQLHSTYSDGYLTPTELVQFISKQGVKIAALTDHNTVGGLDEFKKTCCQYNIKPIIGLELYVKFKNHKFNLLWYNFDDINSELHKILRNSQIRKKGRARKILEKLLEQGFKIDINKILDKYTHYLPINHLTDDFWMNNKIRIRKELENKNPRENDIINEYFCNKDIGILRESYISMERIIKLRKKIGGQLILCHPAKYSYIRKEFWETLKKIGLDGIEILSPHHSINAIMYIQYLAREFDFITTGSSDFHRHEGNNYTIQNSWQYFKIDSKYLRKIGKITA
ncbi:MAG: PHP domain-containing protein [Patescibacteria group bacterium]|nr:PHP domain-containing protein [Patescibacteria group bacterium]MBU1160394.1 PHP domain-containing protein [Patescibacteria group bacterium]MBU1420994.1 PHP domain-containing protein [Patescibacteria group bacterium]MBU1684147.1 PHP domain-containing protein [Patescibacteria group bacterium]MBU1778391.1 PHP domain-containing protein [Patescibacteria group bacterium]